MDPRIWRACAGVSVRIPTVRSRVYYFPQGHMEHSRSSSCPPCGKPIVPCLITGVHLLADPVTDEVFARVLLHPILHSELPVSDPSRNQQKQPGDAGNDDEIVCFAKILTPSDANNGGGFSVPRFCADSIYPPLDYLAEPPVQTLSVTDSHGVVWNFRHIYRGTPRRHLLTTGWSKFVNNKKLIAGDSVVFMKNNIGEMFVGVRRAVRFGNGGGSSARWERLGRLEGGEEEAQGQVGNRFCGSGRERLTPEAVADAAGRAALGLPFEVVYYPRAGWSDFVVRADVVEAALTVMWSPGMSVKMALESDDSSRMSWIQGIVSSAQVPQSGIWRGSPWRMLQIQWDDPNVQSMKRVSPWEVEFIGPAPALHTTFALTKESKVPQNSGFLSEGEGNFLYSPSGLLNSTIEQMNPSLLNYNTFPAGMQGARQDNSSFNSLTNLMSENTLKMPSNNLLGNNMVPESATVSTELNIGKVQSDNLSDNHSCLCSSASELVGNRGYNSTTAGVSSIQLFGKVIHMGEPAKSGFNNVSLEADGGKGYGGAERVDRINVQCPRASAVEASSL